MPDTDKGAGVNNDLLIKANDGKLYYAPAGTLRPVDDKAPGIAAVHRFMDANAGKAIGMRAALCHGPGIADTQAGDGFMADAARASGKSGTS